MNRTLLLVLLAAICFGCNRANTRDESASSASSQPMMSSGAPAPEEMSEKEESAALERATDSPSGSGGGLPKSAPRRAAFQSVSQSSATPPAPPKQRMVIKTAELTLEVEKFDTASAQAQRLAERYGGFVASTSISASRYKDVKEGAVVLRVPAESFETAMSDLRRLGKKIDNETVKGQDITKDFYDLEARLENQKRLEARFQEILKSAKTVQELLNVERELSQTRGVIEQLEGQKRFYIDRAGLSTITARFHEPYPEFAGGDARPSFFGLLGRALSDGVYNFGKNLANVVEFLIAGIPIFALIALIGYAMVWFFKRFVKSPPKKSAVESALPQS